ncbi:hypothetical protein [Nostoc sp. FACHB-110]|uniref:hypothetical protein n=1 Tax=Nostoc sp. FACHB-110 TaxID=2692834 RepID=UPI0016868717|nr:hypothetical protein [Nostoc sp. FACHB-110]MBD2441403.1 hypothetical protein [Nostoc sp. FACHB-110]
MIFDSLPLLKHPLKEHTETYQRYWSDNSHAIIYEKMLSRQQELETIPDQSLSHSELETLLTKANQRIAELEAELLNYES